MEGLLRARKGKFAQTVPALPWVTHFCVVELGGDAADE